jgi:PIN domain nuclease of toxin-antitoxin system
MLKRIQMEKNRRRYLAAIVAVLARLLPTHHTQPLLRIITTSAAEKHILYDRMVRYTVTTDIRRSSPQRIFLF